MRIGSCSKASFVLVVAAVAALFAVAVGSSFAQTSGVSFGKSVLLNESSNRPTSLQFGPDGRLYVAQQNGLIKAYTVQRTAPNNYSVASTENINDVKQIPNHNDDGTLNTTEANRQVTGIVVTGTASNPVIYAGSSDPRIGAGSSGEDKNLDTNSGIVSRLTWNGTAWEKLDLVRGLPRSEENHSVNGMQLNAAGTKLYLTVGGNTNKGATSTNFALLPEFALSAAILEIDLAAIGNTTYDLPTLDDEDRAGSLDANDPFGGNNGKNQAKLVPGGPVQVYASGFRNPYDLVMTGSGRMYTIDNGGNAGWGDSPVNEGPNGVCTNQQHEPGTTSEDSLHYVGTGPGYYGGHPNPTRGNRANTFNVSDPQSPVSVANPVECDYRENGLGKGELTTFPASTNGLDEYTASNFGGALQGEFVAASYDNKIYRLKPNAAGDALVSKELLSSTVGAAPLDVTTQGDAGPFPGTMWVGDIGNGNIVVFEPAGGGPSCGAADDPALDEDGDGFSNADETDNGTDPCSAADTPSDADSDKTSDLNDPDDDNDTLLDTSDPFAVDEDNGKATNLPVNYSWDNDAPNPGGLLGLGFTGLMSNGTSDYKSLYDPTNMTAGGAAGAVTIDKVPSGDALKTTNTQQYGLQFGVNVGPSTGVFTAHTRIAAPFAGTTPQDHQSMGLFIGDGDQDDYAKVVTVANGGVGGIQFTKEVGGTANTRPKANVAMPGPDYVDLYLVVDPAANTVKPYYLVTTNGVTGPRTALGTATSIPAAWLNGTKGLAVGLISTSVGPGPEFPATWNFIEVMPGETLPDRPGEWQTLAPSSKNRQEVSYTQAGGRFYLAGGQSALHERYDPATDSWEQVEPLPTPLENIQSVTLDGKIYYIGGLVDWPGPHANTVYVYDPATDTFTEGEPMPAGRARGAGGTAVHEGKIYYAGGMHDGTAVPWFDVYDPATDTWTQLPDMPRARDHFHAEVVDGKFYAIGGRDTAVNAIENEVDVYDLTGGSAGGTWQTSDTSLPTARGGFATAVLDKEILIIGGEGGGATYGTVEAYSTVTNGWRRLQTMPTPRHGIQAAVCNGGVYVAAGGKTQGGASPTSTQEAFFLNGPTTCEAPPGDTLPPVAGSPVQILPANNALGTSTVPVKLSWSATDSGSGLSRYELQQKINGDAYTNVSLASAKTTTITPSLAQDTTYRYRVRAKDQAGNWSGWKYGPSFTVNTPFQESDGAIEYTGDWTSQALANSSGGSVKHANTGGNSARLTFTGRNVAWVAQKGKDRGKAEVWVDGVKAATVDLYVSTTQARKMVFTKSWTSPGTHTIEVRTTGAKNASSTGTRVDVDAFEVLGSDTAAPTVDTVEPEHLATDVAPGAGVEATFSEAIEADTLTNSSFTLKQQGSSSPVSALVSYDEATRKATLDPDSNLEQGANYTATVKGGPNGVKDVAGNPLGADETWSFVTTRLE